MSRVAAMFRAGGASYDGYTIGGATKGEAEARAWRAGGLHALRSAELAARSADVWRGEEFHLNGRVAASAAALRTLALEDETLAARGVAVRSNLEGALAAQRLAEKALANADKRALEANSAVAVGELEIKSSTEEVETATEGVSTAHRAVCDAEASHHRARDLLAHAEAAVKDLAVKVRDAHGRSQDSLRRQQAAFECLNDAAKGLNDAESEELVSQDALGKIRQVHEDCKRQLEDTKAELKKATKNMQTAHQKEFEASSQATEASQKMRRCEEATGFLGGIAKMGEGSATDAMNEAQRRLAKFPPDPAGIGPAIASEIKSGIAEAKNTAAEQMSQGAQQDRTQKEQKREEAGGSLETAKDDHADKAEKHRQCAEETSQRKVELEAASVRHREAAARKEVAKKVHERAQALHKQQKELSEEQKATEEKLSAEQAEAQSALEKAKTAVAAAAENSTSSRQQLSESTARLHHSYKKAESARLRASMNRNNQAWTAEAGKQARLQSMFAADHGLALQEGWALHRAAHDGVCAAKAAVFERALDDQKAVACAARSADAARAEAAQLDLLLAPAVGLPAAALVATPGSAGADVPTVCYRA